jgi:hypothetical protein
MPTPEVRKLVSTNGDCLDAYAAWLLGQMWVESKEDPMDVRVGVLGDERAGSFLLPRTNELTKAWKDFKDGGFAKHGNCR